MASLRGSDPPTRRRRRIFIAWAAVALFLVSTLTWAAWPPHQESVTLGKPVTKRFDGCRAHDKVEWSSGFGLDTPPPPFVLPRVHARVENLTAEASGTLVLGFQVYMNGVNVHQSLGRIPYKTGKVVQWSGEAADSFDELDKYAHRAGANDVRLEIDVSCFVDSGRGMKFALQMGPMDVVTQQERGWFEW